MAIITVSAATQLLGITSSTYDSIFTILIPHVQKRICLMTNNWFVVSGISETSLDCDFTTSTLTVSGIDWSAEGFATGDEILVDGSYRNDGWYTISAVSSSVLTIVSTASFVSEVSGASVTVALVRWDTSIQPIVANMLKYDVDIRPKNQGLSSISLGNWSESYTQQGYYGYPQDIISGLLNYTIPRIL
jgi:hypothetical protein